MKSNNNIYLESLKKEILPNNKRSNFLIRILENAINNPLPKGPDVDFHHIIPHSWDGPNNKENLVPLLKGHHFKVHQLLSEVVIDKDKKSSMQNAYWQMSNCGKYKIKNHKEYEKFQKKYSNKQIKERGEWWINKTKNEKKKFKEKEWNVKRNKGDEYISSIKQKQSKANKGKRYKPYNFMDNQVNFIITEYMNSKIMSELVRKFNKNFDMNVSKKPIIRILKINKILS